MIFTLIFMTLMHLASILVWRRTSRNAYRFGYMRGSEDGFIEGFRMGSDLEACRRSRRSAASSQARHN